MQWYLVNKFDEIVSKCEIASGVGISGAKTYFMGIKKMDEEGFDKLWKVMSAQQYDLQFRESMRGPSSQEGTQGFARNIEWWKEDKEIIDDELRY